MDIGVVIRIRHAVCLVHQGITGAYFCLDINSNTDPRVRLITVGHHEYVAAIERSKED
jgi:hypothetical protein